LKKTLIFLLTLFLLSPEARATTYSGRLTTAVYSHERADQDTVKSGSFRAYQSAQLKLANLRSRPELSFQAYGRISDDLLDAPSSDPAYRLYHAHLKWMDARDRFRFTLGRQSIFAGVGVGRMDGLRVRVAPTQYLRFDFYGGALVQGSSEGLSSFSSAKLIGAHLVLADVLGWTAGASGFRKSRESEAYLSPARVAGGLPTLEIQAGEVEQQMIGFDLSRKVGRLALVSRWDLSTPQSLKTRRFEGVVRFADSGWMVSGAFLYRRPYVDQNSVFSVFTQSSNQEFTLRASKRFNRHLGVFSEVSRIAYDDDQSYRVNLGINVLNGYVGYSRRSGFGGAADGLNGRIVYRLNKKLTSSASMGLTSFRTYSGTGLRSRVMSNTVGLSYRAHKKLSLTLQGQSLNQDLEATSADPFTGAGRDLRVFFSASTWFFHKGRR